MLKERKVREETIFVALPEEIRRPSYLRISNNSSNIFLSAVVLPDFTENTALKKVIRRVIPRNNS